MNSVIVGEMTKLTKNAIEEIAIKWLENERWIVDNDLADFILDKMRLEKISSPMLIRKGDFVFFVALFNKSSFFFSLKHGLVTGMDYDKYLDLKEITKVSGLPIAFLFHTEEENSFIFRQMNLLPQPIIWHKEAEKRKAIAIWKVEKFTDNTIFQPSLFTPKIPISIKQWATLNKIKS